MWPWLLDLILGWWNGFTAWIVFIVHIFGGWRNFPFYDVARGGGWYDLGFLLGAGSPIFGALGTHRSGCGCWPFRVGPFIRANTRRREEAEV